MSLKRSILLLATGLVGIALTFGMPRELHVPDAEANGMEAIPVSLTRASLVPQWTERSVPPGNGIPKRPRLRCASSLVIDNNSGEILYSQNADEVRPIASLTKLLTALVFLESGTDMMTTATVTKEDAYRSSKSHLRVGYELRLRDFLAAALVSSDNRAARVLARSAGMTRLEFIDRMNQKAKELGLDSTFVVEPTGLSDLNVSTARECAMLLHVALNNHLIRRLTTVREIDISPVNKRRTLHLVNTNRLLRYGYDFLGGKTGYISEAGWCIAARGVSDDGHDVTAVILGSPTNSLRFRSLRNALLWAYQFPSRPATQS
ncbi:MAG: D-alanyl-D-alanine endopeptidase [Candidatus Zixiibacteriota bacterium]